MSEVHKNLVDSQLEKVESFLDTYEKSVGLSNLETTDVSMYLKLNQEQMRKLSPDECVEAAYLLNQEALYIQHQINKYNAQAQWAKNRIDKSILSDLENIGNRYLPFEAKRTLAIKQNTYAKELQDVVHKAELIISRISYIPNHLKNLANILLDYKYNKLNTIREQKNEST